MGTTPRGGAVGAKLLYPDRSVQHAGVILGMGLAGHVFAGAREDVIGPYGTTGWYRDFLALTAACLMLRRDRFEAVGVLMRRTRWRTATSICACG
jgi:GT2 family glycosyltransferase